MPDDTNFTTFEFQLLPNMLQRHYLHALLNDLRHIYNAALHQRRDAYRKQKHLNSRARNLPSRFSQHRELTVLREEDQVGIGRYSVDISRSPLNRLDKAYRAAFRRLREGISPPGFPRFKGSDHFTSFDFNSKPFVAENKIHVPNLGPVKFNQHRQLPGIPRDATVKYYPGSGKWRVFIKCAISGELPPKPDPASLRPSQMVGADLGLKQFLVLSDGTCVENPRLLRKTEEDLKELDRVLSRKLRGSNNRKKAKRDLARGHEKLQNRRKDFHCKTACELVSKYPVLVLEDLSIQEMLCSDSSKPSSTGLRKSISDAGWGQFTKRVQCKAESAGSWCLLVAPTGTTQTCSGCQGQPSVRKTLRDRIHECEHCGLKMDRDLNASLNIKARGLRALEAVVAEAKIAERGASSG